MIQTWVGLVRRVAFALVLCGVAVIVADCEQHDPPAVAAASCAMPDGRVLDVEGRDNGVFGVVGDIVEREPLSRFDHMTLQSDGVDEESGKRWLRIRLTEDDGATVQRFTAEPREDRSIAVVVDGAVACHHKIRTPITSNDIQVSCCDPAACERWLALLR